MTHMDLLETVILRQAIDFAEALGLLHVNREYKTSPVVTYFEVEVAQELFDAMVKLGPSRSTMYGEDAFPNGDPYRFNSLSRPELYPKPKQPGMVITVSLGAAEPYSPDL